MASVKDILSESEFDLDAASRSLPTGGENGAGNASDGANGNPRSDSAPVSGNSGVENGSAAVNPADATPGSDDNRDDSRRGSSRRTRSGSAPGSTRTRAPREEEATVDLDALLITVHRMVARIAAAPEFEIDKDEAHALSVALKRVAKYISKKVLSPQQEAIGALILTLAALYVPRWFIYQGRTGGPVVDAKTINSVNVKVG